MHGARFDEITARTTSLARSIITTATVIITNHTTCRTYVPTAGTDAPKVRTIRTDLPYGTYLQYIRTCLQYVPTYLTVCTDVSYSAYVRTLRNYTYRYIYSTYRRARCPNRIEFNCLLSCAQELLEAKQRKKERDSVTEATAIILTTAYREGTVCGKLEVSTARRKVKRCRK